MTEAVVTPLGPRPSAPSWRAQLHSALATYRVLADGDCMTGQTSPATLAALTDVARAQHRAEEAGATRVEILTILRDGRL